MSSAIRTSGLTKAFGSTVAVDGLDLDVAPGTVVGLIGPNGAGKTTTLRLLLDIIRPTSGRARVLGVNPRQGGPALRRRIGFIPGDLRLGGRHTGASLLRFFAEVSGGVTPGAIESLAERFEVDLSRPIRALSKGNRQKIGLIQAFMHEPELLILDEPTSGLDPLMQRQFLEMVRECRDTGQTVLLSSHVLSEIEQTADAVWVMSAGRIVAHGAVSELRITSLRRVRAVLEGSEAAVAAARLVSVPGVSGMESTPRPDSRIRLSFRVDGDIHPVVQELARARVIELTIDEPDLEESVLELYGNHGGSGG